MILTIETYAITCDNCDIPCKDSKGNYSFSEIKEAKANAIENGYIKVCDKHYCEKCYMQLTTFMLR